MSVAGLNRINSSGQALAAGSVVALGLSLPVSTALDSVLLGLLLVGFLVSGNAPGRIGNALRNPAALTLVGFFGLVALGMFHGDAPADARLSALKSYLPLVMVLFFLPLFADEKLRRRALIAFGIATAISLLLSLLLAAGWLPDADWIKGSRGNPVVFKHRITHSVFLAFAAFLFVSAGLRDTVRWRSWVLFGLAALAFVDVLFLVQGRTGQIVVLVLAVYLLASRLGWRGLVLGAIAAGFAIVLAWQFSTGFRDRAESALVEIQSTSAGKPATEEDSTGLRLEWYVNTLRLIADRPWLGAGTGGFQPAYAELVTDPAKSIPSHPHNQFLLTASELGVPGALLLVAAFGWLWWLTRRIPGELERSLARALLLTMVIGCMFNSWLIDHAEGIFFVWMVSLVYASVGTTSGRTR